MGKYQSSALAGEPKAVIAGKAFIVEDTGLANGWMIGAFENGGRFIDFVEHCLIHLIPN